MTALQSRPRRRQSGKSRRTYREPDSESDLDLNTITTKPRPTRSGRRIQTYREKTSSSEDDIPSSASDSAPGTTALRPSLQTKAGRRRNATRRSQRQKRQSTTQNELSSSRTFNSFKRRKLDLKSQHAGKSQREAVDVISNTPVNQNAPPWQTLEYEILLTIMQYAAYPLYTSTFRGGPSIEWLVGVSKLCRTFHDAATTALLWEPPLLPVFRAHGLLTTLSQDQSTLTLNYRNKIRSLNIEVKHLLVKKSGIDVETLLQSTPLLSGLRIFHWHDEMVGKAIWAESTVSHFKWSYGSLFDHLDNNKIRLKSFEWNGRFQDTLSGMTAAHKRPCLSNIESMSFVNLNYTEKQEDERLQAQEIVIEALSLLPALTTLEFRNCTILDVSTMSQIPLGLKSLKLVNCLGLTSDGAGAYLTLGGNNLRALYLEGNQVMDLAFLPRLAELCPRLEELYIDLSYEDCSSYRDRNPLYDELLPNGSPTWPLSLTSIVVGPLRSLDISDAEDFYSSLIDAAGSLTFLRVLSIKTILAEASWRDRARLRSKWRPLFEKVFATNKTYTPTVPKVKQAHELEAKGSQRKSARIQELEDNSISEDADADEASDSNLDILGLTRQNRCEIVEFELSDQRPAQEQFREADFLDSEPSGDDEWNGRDQVVSGTRYAW